MQPTPPQSDEDIAKGFSILMGNIGYLRQQVEAYNKRPLPATEEHLRDLIKNEKERPINVPAAQVVEHLMGKTEELVKQFQSLYNQFILLLDKRTQALTQELTTQAKAIETAAAAVQVGAKAVQDSAVVVAATGEKLHRPIRVEGEVFGFTNWKIAVGCLMGPVLFLLLVQALTGQFSKVSKSDFEQAQVKEMQAMAANADLKQQGRYYLDQITKYKAKNPKSTDFPDYKPEE